MTIGKSIMIKSKLLFMLFFQTTKLFKSMKFALHRGTWFIFHIGIIMVQINSNLSLSAEFITAACKCKAQTSIIKCNVRTFKRFWGTSSINWFLNHDRFWCSSDRQIGKNMDCTKFCNVLSCAIECNSVSFTSELTF